MKISKLFSSVKWLIIVTGLLLSACNNSNEVSDSNLSEGDIESLTREFDDSSSIVNALTDEAVGPDASTPLTEEQINTAQGELDAVDAPDSIL